MFFVIQVSKALILDTALQEYGNLLYRLAVMILVDRKETLLVADYPLATHSMARIASGIISEVAM